MRTSISKKTLIIVLLTIPHLKPGYMEFVPMLDSLFNILRIVSFVTIVSLVIVKRQPVFLVHFCIYIL